MASWILGLTGGIGAGKSLVTNHLMTLNIDIVDADVIAREVVALGSQGLTDIVNHFGSDILLPDGSLNRTKLRSIIFSDTQQKNWLNGLLHPLIRQNMSAQLAKSTSNYVVLSAPLLFENKLDVLCNHTLLIDVPVKVQIARTMTRDTVSQAQVESIIQSQMSREEKIQKADTVLDNNRSINDVLSDVNQLHLNFEERANIEVA